MAGRSGAVLRATRTFERASLFSEGEAVSFVEAPHRSGATGNPCLGHRRKDLVECRLRLPGARSSRNVPSELSPKANHCRHTRALTTLWETVLIQKRKEKCSMALMATV